MALLESRKNEEGHRNASTSLSPNKSCNKDSHFYKIIVSPSTQSHKIRIPQDYVKKYGRRQLKRVYMKLRVPDGKVWKVKLSKESDSNVWLTKGWEVFYKNYGLHYGYFLLFRYDKGDHQFYVTIFDLTSCEIEYNPIFHDYMDTPTMPELSSQVEGMELGDCNEILNYPGDGLAVQDGERVNNSPNPHFEIVMRLSHISNRYLMHFPYRHVKEHLKTDEKRLQLIWTTPNEKHYVMRLTLIKDRNIAQLRTRQWRKFVQENELQEGDTCAFELVEPERNAYKVTIVRASN